MELRLKRKLWCYLVGKLVDIEGDIVAYRQADVLAIRSCDDKDCGWRGTKDCQIGKEIEGRWVTLN